MDVIFRYKNKDGVIMAFKVEEQTLWGDTFFDKNSVYLDMQDNDIEAMINALKELRNESGVREKKMKNNWNVIAKDVGKNQKGTTLWLREYVWGDVSNEYDEEELKNIRIIPYEEWTANDFAQILSNEYEDANYHNFVEAPYEILRAIRETQTSFDLDDKLMKNICERLYDLI